MSYLPELVFAFPPPPGIISHYGKPTAAAAPDSSCLLCKCVACVEDIFSKQTVAWLLTTSDFQHLALV